MSAVKLKLSLHDCLSFVCAEVIEAVVDTKSTGTEQKGNLNHCLKLNIQDS